MRTTIFLLILFSTSVFSQGEKNKIPHQFNITKKVATSTVKSQGITSTCWAFATTSFIEAEILRLGNGEFDLSEMYFIRKDYPLKAEKFMRYHGLSNFGPGGLGHDALNTISKCGIVPESVYGGKLVDSTKYNHSELHNILETMLQSVVKQKKISTLWMHAFNSILDVYLGELPTKFTFDGAEYTPKSFAKSLEFNPDDYIEFTSYTHIPFYKNANLEISDNWSNAEYFNIPIDELISLMNASIDMGYSFLWDGDVGKEYFYRSGYAVMPIDDWKENGEPETEKNVTQKMRQISFDTFVTTDDHLMHITGVAKNQNGTKFYYTKNSWGSNKGYDGYWYMSEQYVRLMTISIMVHKDVLPKDLKEKLKI